MFWSEQLGYWVVTRYGDIKSIFRDHRRFSPSNALEKITKGLNPAYPFNYNFLDQDLGTTDVVAAQSYMEDSLRMLAHLIMSLPEYQLS